LEYVIDASVAAKWFFAESHSAEAGLLLTNLRLGSVRLSAPDLLLAEMGNILWKRVALRGEGDIRAAQEFYADLLQLGIELIPIAGIAARPFSLRPA
jgi:predicted nucleic acid-binding protein